MPQELHPSRIPTPATGPLEPAREQTLQRLHEALECEQLTLDQFDERVELAISASNRAELAVLVRDLPQPRGERALVPRDRPASGRVVAIMGGTERRGEWSPPPVLAAWAIMGGVDLDLREALLAPGVTEVKCRAIMGGVTIIGPEVRVEVHGTGIMGGFVSRSTPGEGPHPPVVRVTGVALMGGVDVMVKTRRT